MHRFKAFITKGQCTGKMLFVKALLLALLAQGSFAATALHTVQNTETAASSTAAQQPDARTFEDGFKEKYKDSDFNYKPPTIAKSRWERIKEWFLRWLGELFTSDNPDKTNSIVRIVLRVVAIVVILFVVYLIVASIINNEGMWIFGRSRKKIAATAMGSEDITQMDFRTLIENTKKDDNYRLAVRYYYLWLLKKLSVNNIIDWNWEKTNSDYLYEIKDASLRKEFEYLSYVYDYSWYGEFTLTGELFDKAEKAFLKTFKNL